jgi:hypothetical protein
MSKRIYLTTAILILAATIFATHVVRARRAACPPATEQAFSMMFMSDPQFTCGAAADLTCFTQDCQDNMGKSTNAQMNDAMVNAKISAHGPQL